MKKVLSVLLSFVMLFSITVSADLSAYALTSGDWEYSTATGGVSITAYKGSETQITIPSKLGTLSRTVVSIGDNAFKDNTQITEIVIPDSIKSIGASAFSGCTQLKNISIPSSVTSIGESALGRCTELSSVELPDTITTISKSMFLGCKSLKSISLPSNLKSIGSTAFAETGLEKIDFPSSVTSIGMMAFAGCESLTEVTTPIGINIITFGVFAYCSNLKCVTITQGVKKIESLAFSECNALTDVYYLSTRAEWNEIYIDTANNISTDSNSNEETLLNAKIRCIDDVYSITVKESSLGTSTINGVDVMLDPVTLSVYDSLDVTLEATPVEGAEFIGWSLNGKLISTSPTTVVKALANSTYVPIFRDISENSYTVVFADKYGNIFSAQSVYDASEIKIPSPPVIPGYTFAGWSLSESQIAQLKSSAAIQALYSKNKNATCYVSANNCTITTAGMQTNNAATGVAFDTLVKVHAENALAWKINDAIVAYGDTYSFYVGSNISLTPVFEDVAVDPIVAAVSVTEVPVGDKKMASFLATRTMTNDCEYVNAGFIYGKNLDKDEIRLSDVDNSTVKAFYCSTNAEQFSLNYGIDSQTGKITARAFLAYTDSRGIVHIVYASPQIYTY